MEEMTADRLKISQKISGSTRDRLETAIELGVIDENALISFLQSKENRVNKRQRKEQKKNGHDIIAVNGKEPLSLISLEQSREVWGDELIAKPHLRNLSEANNPALKNPRFNFFTALLNGLSIRQMAKKYPEIIVLPKTKAKDLLDRYSKPGYYFISLDNELAKLPEATKKERWPENCYRLDINLLVELFICLIKLQQPIPKVVFKTSYGPTDHEVCVREENGRIFFTSAANLKEGESYGLCLDLDQPWMDNWTD